VIDRGQPPAWGNLTGPLVIDCCITMSWCFVDEFNVEAATLLRLLPASEAFVPSHWPLEMAHVLLKGERRGRIGRSEADRFLALLGSLPITVDEEPMIDTFPRVLDLARTHGLSSHDAAYLECALRRNLPLATLDAKLKAAAHAVGVPLFEAPEGLPGDDGNPEQGGTP